MRINKSCLAAGTATAVLAVVISGCGQRSARYISAPPESTPGWNEYDFATETELHQAATPTELTASETEPSSEDALINESVHSIDYDIKDFPGAVPGWYEKTDSAGDVWYFFDSEMRLLTDWQYIDGSWYYLSDDGRMASDTVIDGWYVDADGRRQDELPEGYELVGEAERESIAASIAAEAESREAESESAAEVQRQQSILRAAHEDMSRVQSATDRHGTGDGIGDKPSDGTQALLEADISLSGAALGNGVTETDDFYIIDNASLSAARTLSSDTVADLGPKDSLDISYNGKDYHLMVMSTGSDKQGHKTVEFQDDLLELKYTPFGYVISDGGTAEEQIYSGSVCIAKDAVIGLNSKGVRTEVRASDYIADGIS